MLLGKKNIIGLDIGSTRIKAVQLKEYKNGYQLERLGIIPLDSELIVEGSILDSTRVVEAIKQLISDANITGKDATLSVSGHSSVIIKKVSLPQMSEDELEDSIKFEAEQYIPFDIEDVNLDCQVLGTNEEDNNMEVLIVAAKKDKINEYVSVVRESGLNPIIVDVDAFAVENTYEFNYEIEQEQNIALVNIGASSINVNILKGGVSVFVRDSAVGSNLLTEAIQKEFTISYANAEKLKQGGDIEGISREDAISVINSACEGILAEISRSFDYFKDTSTYETIEEIILSGGGGLTEDFASLLSQRVEIDASIIDPFKKIHVPDMFDKEYVKKVAPIVSVAIGLALRREEDK